MTPPAGTNSARPEVVTRGISSPRPAWVEGESPKWPRAQFVTGVGSADDDRFQQLDRDVLASAGADAIGRAEPEDTAPTRAFSGRLGRGIANAYVRAANGADAPKPGIPMNAPLSPT